VDVDVVPASAELVPDIVALARAARDELTEVRGGILFVGRDSIREPLEPAFQALAEADRSTLLAGTIDGTAVGYAVVVADDATAVLREIAVDPQAREIGLGEALLDAAVAWARDRGCTGIDSFALPGARETKNFFETAGMKTRLLVVHRDL
jgi:GNAT superfamily N-acetyltransferase